MWFLKCVAGSEGQKGCLKYVTVTDKLAKLLAQKLQATTVVEEDAEVLAEDDESDDPMLKLDGVEEKADPVKKLVGRPRKRTFRKRTPREQTRAIDLEMPVHPRESGHRVDETVKVWVLAIPKVKSLFIRVDCLSWLIAYAADEYYYKGISRAREADDVVAVAAKTRVEWDFDENHWTAIFCAPDGCELRMSLTGADIKEKHWLKLSELGKVNGPFCAVTQDGLKSQAKVILDMWIEACKTETVEKFASVWGEEFFKEVSATSPVAVAARGKRPRPGHCQFGVRAGSLLKRAESHEEYVGTQDDNDDVVKKLHASSTKQPASSSSDLFERWGADVGCGTAL